MKVRVIVLGNESAGDDGAALAASRALASRSDVELVLAGRPGVGLLDLLDVAVPTVLVDVVRSGAPSGQVHELGLEELARRALAREQVSSHGFGPAEALRLGSALGRELPAGRFVGIEGACFDPGARIGDSVQGGLDALTRAIERAIDAARREMACTSTGSSIG